MPGGGDIIMSALPLEVIIFPDVIDAAIGAVTDLVGSKLDGAPVVGRVPPTRPKRFVRLRLVGGARETLISRQATLTVEGYAQTETDATRLCEIVTAALVACDGAIFGGYEIAGPADLPDPTTSQERTTATVGIRVRGSSLA